MKPETLLRWHRDQGSPRFRIPSGVGPPRGREM
jgi:hypothetical protein